MYDQVLDDFRKATESTVQWQQDLLKSWTRPWLPEAGGAAGPAAGWVEQVQALQKQWAGAVADLMGKQCEVLEARYRAGINAIDEAVRTGVAPSPDAARGPAEGLWRQNFESLRALVESQMKEFRTLTESWLAMGRAAAPKA